MITYRTDDTDTLGSLAVRWYPDLPWWMGATMIQEANGLKGEWSLANKTLVIPELPRQKRRQLFQ